MKEICDMNWPERMRRALAYLEENLAGDIDFGRAAQMAACSPFYFQRLFSIVTGMTVGEYIRRRRLTLAGMELASGTTKKVIDVALKYGYDSPDAFTRAFKAMHGVSPSAARKPGKKLAACPRISFHIELKGDADMDYRIIERHGFLVAVVTRRFTTENEQNFRDIRAWWQEFLPTADFKAMTDLTGGKPGAVTGGISLGICFTDDKPMHFSYGIAVELPEGSGAGKFKLKRIPAATWAVFDCTLANLQDVTRRIFTEWFPSTGYEHADVPELEVYLPGSEGQNMKCEIWIPVVKK
jgi:AraC family transcriptional regulator